MKLIDDVIQNKETNNNNFYTKRFNERMEFYKIWYGKDFESKKKDLERLTLQEFGNLALFNELVVEPILNKL